MPASNEPTSNLTLRGLPSRVRAKLTKRAKSRHQSLNAYLLDLLTREAEIPTMSEVLDDIEAIRRPTGVTDDDAVAAVRAARDAQDARWA
ncbi:MAG: hypothetical protein JOY82_15510 [Streptosporangiaceae bacterium]|nr:hypothetical protein [Streptosporangiaceae bacterium]MBV9855897.1 hypothetical protein [Streptosporangiaceae bacterium]